MSLFISLLYRIPGCSAAFSHQSSFLIYGRVLTKLQEDISLSLKKYEREKGRELGGDC